MHHDHHTLKHTHDVDTKSGGLFRFGIQKSMRRRDEITCSFYNDAHDYGDCLFERWRKQTEENNTGTQAFFRQQVHTPLYLGTYKNVIEMYVCVRLCACVFVFWLIVLPFVIVVVIDENVLLPLHLGIFYRTHSSIWFPATQYFKHFTHFVSALLKYSPFDCSSLLLLLQYI